VTLVSIFSLAAFVGTAAAAPPKAKLGAFCNTSGTGAGQCGLPRGLAVNFTGAGGVPGGSVYLIDATNNRIQQFSATGAFIRAFGKEVDQTTGGDLCTAASGDVCKAGVVGDGAGALNGPYGIAIDQTTGAVYVSEQNSRRIDVFSALGAFEGAIGWNVDPLAPAEELQFCTTATGCQAGVSGGAAGQFANLKLSGVAVDPRNGNLYVADLGNLRIAEYAIATSIGGEVEGASFVRALGWSVDASAPAEELQECTVLTGCQAGSSGWGDGQFVKEGTNGFPGPIAVDSNGNIYAVGSKGGSCSPAEPCRIQKFNPDGTFKEVFGPSAGECQITYTSGTAAQVEAFDIAVDPVSADHDNHVFVTKKISATGYRVYEFDEDGANCVVSPIGPSLLGTAQVLNHGLAVGAQGRVYATNGAAEVARLGEAPPPAAAMIGVTNVAGTSARFAGEVSSPAEVEGQSFVATWHFEYSTDQRHWTPVPVPDRTVASGPGVPEAVEESVSGLAPGARYFVRICATTAPTVCSTETEPALEFTTETIAPTVLPFSAEVTQTDATLGAEINPNNLATRYQIDWATASEWAQMPGFYGHHLPAGERQVGSGSEIVIAREQLGGLSPASTYHFRVRATNSAGITTSPDQLVETLNACGLTDGRCFELVSEADKGPVASPGRIQTAGLSPQFQVAPEGSALAYTVESAYPGATAGEEATYLARRGTDGWRSEGVFPPSLEPRVADGASGGAGRMKLLSSDLSCGVVVSPNRLTADAPPAVREAGRAYLYRRDDSTGTYSLITALVPVNLPAPSEQLTAVMSATEYQVIGMSPDCERVVFRTMYRYPGIPSVSAASQLYEWDGGTVRNVALIPGPGGPTEPLPVESIPGAMNESALETEPLGRTAVTNIWRSVSGSGSRAIFTAVSRYGGDSGRRAIFVRDAIDPAVLTGTEPAIDISQSETATANDGYSRYWTASADGERILFTARYGLATKGLDAHGPSSSTGAGSCSDFPTAGTGEGCDLYAYEVGAPDGEHLTDLSADVADAKGAGVVGVLAASDDASYVYFAARGRLGGAGRTEAENRLAGTYNVYLTHGEDTRFVGEISQDEATGSFPVAKALLGTPSGEGEWTSRTTPDGSEFIFESSLGVSGGVRMVYLYSAADGTTTCVSCRHDGKSPFAANTLTPLISAKLTNLEERTIQPVTLTENGRVYFYSFDPLATGAVEGDRNLYQWEHGQVSLIATEPAGVPRSFFGTPSYNFFGGASADGGDVYFTTPVAITGDDQDERWDVYDARVGGGFPEPASPVSPCDATAEGGCNSGEANAPSPAAVPATSSFTGPGNPPPTQHKPKQKKKHKQQKKPKPKKKQKQQKKQHMKAGKNRRANANGGAAK